ncbi:MAG: ribonuclease D [Alphaproteobacteria bacterium]
MTKIITQTQDLENFCNHLKTKKWLTVDTEFIREKTYCPELCLIQAASDEQEVLIDPLAKELDLNAFWKVLADKNIVKILHAASQDLEIFYHQSSYGVCNIFDSQIAAQALGYGESIGYDRLVEDICGVVLDKSSRHTDWRLRPLSDKQKIYAIADVTYLRDVYLNLQQRLAQKGRLAWIEEEIANQCNKNRFQRNPSETYLRIKIRNPKRKSLVVLQELAAWRDDEAYRRNIPRQFVVKDETLINLAILQPRDKKALAQIRTVSEKQANGKQGEIFLSLIDKALNRPKESWPEVKKVIRLGKKDKTAIELLKTLLRVVAEENELTSHLIANNDDIYKLATQKEEANIACLKGWRGEIFGQKALDLLEGKIALALHKGNIRFVRVSFVG